jgi:hypothetical protein
MRWVEDVENDLRELKVKRWRQNPNNREEWTLVVKESEVRRGPQNQGASI